ncbi:hypothetical protein B0H19DRAFT_1110477 [Mycena capillaripes]|nr:hypothetical protein B0H19DRAFT_1110477 [Mycena capillaripes]
MPHLPDLKAVLPGLKAVFNRKKDRSRPTTPVPVITSSAKDPPTVGMKSMNTKELVVDNVALLADIAEQVSGFIESVPFIAPLAGCLSQIIKVYKEVKTTDEKREALLARIAYIARDLHATVLRMEEAGHIDVLTRLKPDLETYAGLVEEAAEFVANYDEIGAVRRSVARNQFGGDFSTLQQNLDSFGARFRTNRLVDLSIQQTTMKGTLDEIHSTVTVDKLEKWLGPLPNMKTKQHDTQSLRMEGTGDWFLDGLKFVDWQDNPGTLWIQGNSGAGKSVLSSAVIDKLIHDQKLSNDLGKFFAVAFFYFDFKDKESHVVERALRRIILQLSEKSPYNHRALEVQYKLSGQTLPTYQDLRRILEELLRELDRTYIIFDALDECPESELMQLISLLSRLRGWTEHPIHLLFTSQPRGMFTNSFKDVPCIYLESGVTDKDIRVFVEEKLRDMKIWSSRVDEITDRVAHKSSGMFRFAACLIVELSYCKRQNELDIALDNLPNDLFGIYSRFLQRIRPKDFVYVTGILRWMVFSRRHLVDSVTELADAVSFDYSDPAHHTYDPSLRNDHLNSVLNWLEGLVTVTTDRNGKQCLVLAHASVEDYILSNQFKDEFRCDLGAGLSHTFIAQSCIGYLLHFSGHPPDPSTSSGYLLAEYAAHHWCYHVLCCHDQSVILSDAMYLLQDGSKQYIALNNLRNGEFSQTSPITPPLCLCSQVGYTEGVRALLKNGAKVNTEGRDGTVLQIASSEGHTQIVDCLLRAGADTKGYARALQYASWCGRDEIALLLLEHGADVHAPGGQYYPEDLKVMAEDKDVDYLSHSSALEAACHGNHTKIVRLLVEYGASIDAWGLQAAAATKYWFKDTELVAFLLESGADVNEQGGPYGNALHAAVGAGNTDIACLLIEKGAEVNARVEEYGSPLEVAVQKEHLEIVQLLLEHGADVHADGGSALQSALATACCLGRTEIIRCLLAHGADVNAQGGRYESALQAALSNDCKNSSGDVVPEWFEHRDAVVAFLIENGAVEAVVTDNAAETGSEVDRNTES